MKAGTYPSPLQKELEDLILYLPLWIKMSSQRLGAGALGRPRGMLQGGRWEEGSGWGTHVYLWRIHVDIWQNQYNIVKLKNKKTKAVNKQKAIEEGSGGPEF